MDSYLLIESRDALESSDVAEILADEFSLRERGIPTDRLDPCVVSAPIDVVIDRLVQGRKALWH